MHKIAKSVSKQSYLDFTESCHFWHIHTSLNYQYITLGNGWFTWTFEVCRSKAFVTCVSETHPVLIRWEKGTNYKFINPTHNLKFIHMEIHIMKFTSHQAPKEEEVLPTLQVTFCFKCCNNFNFLHVILNGCLKYLTR